MALMKNLADNNSCNKGAVSKNCSTFNGEHPAQSRLNGCSAQKDSTVGVDASECDAQAQERVREHYAKVAEMVQNASQTPEGFNIVKESRSLCSLENKSEALNIYAEELIEGIPQKALIASRGCADPVSCANLVNGEHVIDLGCGGGIDAIIASRLVGESGKVYGLDMTAEMLKLAKENAKAANAQNIEYIKGTIEDIPLPDNSVDVVLSNCVINFASDKRRVLSEALRILKVGGRFVVSDIVSFEEVPQNAMEDICYITGCANGMYSAQDYLGTLQKCGFKSGTIEPKTIYTKEVLHEKAQRKDRMDAYMRIKDMQIDSKVGSAIIYAYK